jgi:outer membrane murein-binding lipoprotein Lpp
MNQTVTLSLTALVSLVVGGAASYAYTNSIQANKIADFNGQIATLQKQVDEFEAAKKLDVPSDDEATAAVRKIMFFGDVAAANIDQCQKHTMTPGVVCSLTVTDKNNITLPKVFRFVKVDGIWTSQN